MGDPRAASHRAPARTLTVPRRRRKPIYPRPWSCGSAPRPRRVPRGGRAAGAPARAGDRGRAPRADAAARAPAGLHGRPPLRRRRPAVRRGLLPRARDRRRAHAARRQAHLPRARAARRLPDHARRAACRSTSSRWSARSSPRSPTRASRRGTKLGHKHVGVWVGERKIASVGVHISHGVSSHGFAVNVDNDLDPFSWVVACGLPEVQMTSMAAEGSPRASPASASAWRYRFGEAFGRRQRLVSAARLGIERPVRGYGRRPGDLPHRRRHPPGRAGPARPRPRGYESLFVTEHTHIPVAAGMVARDGGAAATTSTAARTTRSWRSRSPRRRPRS